MGIIDIRNFQGEVPKTGPTAIADNQSQRADNVKLDSGELRTWRKPLLVYKPANFPLSIYRLANSTQSGWLTWTTDVDCVPGPLADLTDYRVYYTGDGKPKKTNYSMAFASTVGPFPNTWQYMGVPAPAHTPACTVSGTPNSGATVVTRAYLITYENTFGSLIEEGPPSAPILVNWESGQTVTMGAIPAPPGGMGHDITGAYIYRTLVGATSTTYEQVGRVPLASFPGGFVDNVPDSSLGAALQSLTWVGPPDGLQGIISMREGILAGFQGNELYFSEPYKPHAWPVQYSLSFPDPIVGLGLAGGTLVVCTQSYPWLVNGTHPSNMTTEPVTIKDPCVSKRSITSDLAGMLYASPNGLVGISGIIQGVISDKLIERTAWQQYNPTTMLGAIYDGKYVGFYTYPADGIQPDGIVGSGGRAFIMQKAVEPYRTLFAHMDVASFAMAEPMSFLDFYAYAAYTDRSNGFIYGVSAIDGNIYQLDADPVNVLPIDWRSKRFYSAAPINYGLIQVDADYNDNARLILQKQIDQITAINQAIYATGVTHGETGGSETGQYTTAGSALQDLPGLLDSASLQVSVFADGMQVFTGSPKNFTPLRLPSGFRANTWEIAIASTYTVRAVTMATTMGEIRQAVYGQQQPTQQPQG